jgi:polyvinyl alcohol dehydrogenase (cytochrome)
LTQTERNYRAIHFLLAVFVPILCAQDGATIYKERCTTCHDATEGRAPALSTIKKMSGQAIYIALTSGPMKAQAQGLTTPQLFSLIGFIGPAEGAQPEAPVLTRTCAGPTSSFKLSGDSPHWSGWSSSTSNSRFQSTASVGLAATDMPKLKLKWAFSLGAVIMARSHHPSPVDGSSSER